MSDAAGGGGGGGRPDPAAVGGSATARAVLRLLRLAAVTGGGGRAELLYAGCLFAAITGAVAFSMTFSFHLAFSQLAHGSVVQAAAVTGFFGLNYLLNWVPLAICFLGGRRRHGDLLLAVGRTLGRIVAQPGYRGPAQRLRWEAGWLLAIAVGLIVFVGAGSVYFLITTMKNPLPELLSLPSSLTMLSGVMYIVYNICFYFIPLKYVFAGMHLTSGFRYINAELRAAADGDSQLSPAAVDQLLALHDELASTFVTLTSVMTSELTVSMIYGIVSNVSMWLLFILSLQQGTLATYGVMISIYVVGAGVTVAVPCEVTQRALTAVSDTRDLLLSTERRQPPLGPQLSLFRETVSRDLERLGDLGLFRLQRSTLLSITATVLTYVIVLVQFHDSSQPGCPTLNGTTLSTLN